MPLRLKRPPEDRCAGFSVLSLSLGILALGIVSLFALPAVKKAVMEHRRELVVEDLRAFGGAFQAYAKEHGEWPAGGVAPGVIPPGMETYLASTRWTKGSAIGGLYQWERHTPQAGGRYAAAVVLTTVDKQVVSNDREQLHEIDLAIDDGDLATGQFFIGFHDYPVYVLEH